MRRLKLAAVLLVACAAVWLAFASQRRHAKVVLELSAMGPLLMPMTSETHQKMLALAADPVARLKDFKPEFVYMTATHDGKTIKVRPAYEEKNIRGGTVLSTTVVDFLRSALGDAAAQGVSINPGAGEPVFSVVLPKAALPRVIASLERRGVK